MSETVVFLGNLKTASYGTHVSRAESLGFTVSTTITGTTDYIVCGKDIGTKADKARELGLTILEEEEWEDMLNKREKRTKGVRKKRAIDDNSEDEDVDDTENLFAKPTTYMVARNRYWEIKLDGRKTYIRTGKVGERGLTTMKEHKSCADAKQSMIDLMERKKNQGFQRQPSTSNDGIGMINSSADESVTSKSAVALADGEKVTVKCPKTDKTFTVQRNGHLYTCDCSDWNDNGAEKKTCEHLKQVLGEKADKTRNESSSTQLTGHIFKMSPGLPPSIVKAKPVSIMKARVPELLLAHSWKEDDVDPTGWWMSEKLDGVRAFWCGKLGKFFSRQGNNYAAPDWFTKGLPRDIDLDGELFGGRGKFQSTVSIVKTGIDEWKSITYEIFDVPSYKNAPFEDRMSFIEDMFERQKPTYGRIVQQKRCKSTKDVLDELKRVESLGGEGLMIRKPKSEYVCSRSNVLLKIKSFFDGEALVEGYEPGKGKYQNMTGALKCVMACGNKFKVGSGMTDDDRRNPPKIGSIIVYKCQDLSDSGNPRFPTFVGIAADKDKPKDPDFGHKLKLK